MRFLTWILSSTASAICAAGWARAEEPSYHSFVDFCAYRGTNLTDGHWLGARCRNNMTQVFGYNYTWLDLDTCVGNNGSRLVAYESGNYSTSCTKCSIKNPETRSVVLTCSCQGIDRDGYSKSSLELNTTLYDDNGRAGCFGHLGNKTQYGPSL